MELWMVGLVEGSVVVCINWWVCGQLGQRTDTQTRAHARTHARTYTDPHSI